MLFCCCWFGNYLILVGKSKEEMNKLKTQWTVREIKEFSEKTEGMECKA